MQVFAPQPWGPVGLQAGPEQLQGDSVFLAAPSGHGVAAFGADLGAFHQGAAAVGGKTQVGEPARGERRSLSPGGGAEKLLEASQEQDPDWLLGMW